MNTLFKAMTTSGGGTAGLEDNAPAPFQELETANYSTVIVRDLRVDMTIGIHDHEHTHKQPVIINVVAKVSDNPDWQSDDIDNVVCYEGIINAIEMIAARGHINLLETLAEQIATFCLQNARVENVMVRVEKTEAFDNAAGAGVEIFRKQSNF